VRIDVGGAQVAALTLGARWTRHDFSASRSLLQPGMNRVQVSWPPPGLGDAPLSRIASRLELGLPVDLHPVFGEISSFRVAARLAPSQ